MVGLLSIGLHRFIGGVEALLLGIGMPTPVVSRLLANSGWRFLMISGALPALLVFFIRLFVPESKKWEHERARGATSHWSNVDLIGVTVGCLASIAIIWSWSPLGTRPAAAAVITLIGVAAALWGFLFPVRRYLTRAVSAGSLARHQQPIVIRHMLLGACLAGVALLGTWGSMLWAPRWAFQLGPDASRVSREHANFVGARAIVFPILAGVIAAVLAAASPMRPSVWIDPVVPAALSGNDRLTVSSCFDLPGGGITAAFYGFFHCICLSCSPQSCARPVRDSRTTSAAFSPQLAGYRPRRSWASSAAAFRWRVPCSRSSTRWGSSSSGSGRRRGASRCRSKV
jgi:hypothetical protein